MAAVEQGRFIKTVFGLTAQRDKIVYFEPKVNVNRGEMTGCEMHSEIALPEGFSGDVSLASIKGAITLINSKG